jgi:rhodanese-related sulfurtransferase
MKKQSTLLLTISLGLTLVLAGCGASNTTSEGVEQKPAAVSDSSSLASQPAPKEIKDFKYYTAAQLKDGIEKKSPMHVVDIQVEAEYKDHHIQGVIPTYAYPAKTDEEKAKLRKVLPQLKDSKDPVVIVCPGGKSGAQNTYQYFYDQGIDESRLFILENGQKGWPYNELLEK